MRLPKRILLRIIGSIAAAYLLAMGITWALHTYLAKGEAEHILERILDDVQGQIEEDINRRFVLKTMKVREIIGAMSDKSTEALKRLATEMRVDEVCVVDKSGRFIASSGTYEIGKTCEELGEQAAEFRCLLDDKTEYAQVLKPRSSDGKLFKYVGVWRPEGGFVQTGSRVETLRQTALSTVVGITHNRHVGGLGRVVVTTDSGVIVSDAEDSGLEGSVLIMPDPAETFIASRDIEGFHVYAFLPKTFAVLWRNTLAGVSAFLTLLVLFFSVVFVGISVAGFVREQIEKRVAADLEMAKNIQLSALPAVFPAYPDELRMDIYARMDAAKEVGGDFYDFYHVGPDRFAFLIADVSGKGVGAAMFMMKAKTTIKGCMVSKAHVEDALNEANQRLAEGNAANVFVTCFIGVIDLKEGTLTYVNAGHNPPFIRRKDGSLEQLKVVSGPPLGVIPSARYRVQTAALKPGDLIYLYTDGVTEAINAENEQFGVKRLADFVSSEPRPEALCRRTKEVVDAFAGEREQFDDITALALSYRGEPTVEKREFAATMENLAKVAEFIESALDREECPSDHKAKILIAVDEIGSNVVRYSKSPTLRVTYERAEQPPVVRITFADKGAEWNPLNHRDPNVNAPLEARAIGGLGILMVKKLMDGVRYERRDGENVLQLSKRLPW